MSNYSHISNTDRLEIEILLWKWYSITDIAKVLNRSKSTISREINRNKVKWEYIWKKANHKSKVRRLYCKTKLKKIVCNLELQEYIRFNMIENKWSCEQISLWWNRLNPNKTISYPRIYEYIRSIYWYDIWLEVWIWKKKKKIKKEKFIWKIQYREWIEKRIITDWEFGHYECDSVEWLRWDKWLISTRIEKLTRYMFADKIESKSSIETENVLWKWLLNCKAKSLTFDNWLEFANHYKLWVKTYFCDPYSSRQKWQIERWNRELRKFIPKWTKLSTISSNDLINYINKINNTPRKCLWWNTPAEEFALYNKVALEI